jgi:hypothetical protein
VTVAADRETAAAQTRWDHWEGRYQRSSRRRARQARVAAFLIFAAIVANLLLQLYVTRI